MSKEMLMGDSKGIAKAIEVNFITCAQFLALKQHFENVLDEIKDDEGSRKLRVEFTKLLNVFESCYLENQQKVYKIHELQALVTIKNKGNKSVHSEQEAIIMDLKNTITYLQAYIDNSVDKTEHSKKRQDLENDDNMENKTIQVHSESLENVIKSKIDSNLKQIEDKTLLKHEMVKSDQFKKEKLKGENKIKNYTNATEYKVLRNNLEILVADLKLSRDIIEEQKKQIRDREMTVEDLRKDLLESEQMLAQAQNKIEEIKTPFKIKLNKYKTELVENRKKYEEVSKQLEKLIAFNLKLQKDISSKNSIIDELKVKIADIDLEKESAYRKTEIFENHLAENQIYLEQKKLEVKLFQEEVESLKKQITKQTKDIALPGDKEKKVEINAQERTIESLKNHIAFRDKKLFQMKEELKSTITILETVKKDFNRTNARNISLEAEVREVKERLKEKQEDYKQLKGKFNENHKELVDIKRELQTKIKKYQQAMDKKNKFHSTCNHLKIINDQQKHENGILGKRQQYLVKLLKDKDMEMEKIITWKRYVC